MVATRRGVREDSSSDTNQNTSSVQATPSTDRRTRSAAKPGEGRVQPTIEDPCSQLSVTPVTSTKKRCTRTLRLHSPPLPSTPVGSVHEADVSDGESVCSAASITEPPVTRTRVKTRRMQAGNQENEEISEMESCSSVASTSKSGLRSSRSTRGKTAPQSSDPAQAEVKPDQGSEAESCSSAMSKSQRVTRSQRKAPLTRSSAKLQTVDSEVSDTDSCTSSIVGRGSRRQMRPIPINLEEPSESSRSPQTGRQTRSAGRKAAAPADVTEPPTCDSDGFESGPTYSLSINDQMQPAGCKSEESEFEVMKVGSSVGSPCSTRSRETPSSSRANSGTSSQGGPASRRSARKQGGVTENPAESADSTLESTVIADDEDLTLLEEDQTQTSEAVTETDVCPGEADPNTERKDATNTCEAEDHEAPSAAACVEKAEEESAIITKDQEEELSPEDEDEDVTDVETMQETVTPPERAQPVTGRTPEEASETTEEVEETQEAAAEPTEEEEGVSRLKPATQKVVEDSAVQSTKIISLLDSSDDEDDDFGEEEESEEEEEKRGGPSNMTAESVKGLFMIDTRPGQEADELYYREEEEDTSLRLHQDEEDEEFVDEEGDDDDEDTQILLSSRSSHLKEMSSRIDPGIRVKELGGLYISFDGSKSNPVSSSLQKLKEKKNLDEVMKKSVIGPDFEKKDTVPPYSESSKALKLKHRAEREKSAGNGWFDMKAPELTPELKADLKVLKMRGSLEPKRFYKKNDRDGFPKYFQIGTVVDSPADFYHSQMPKKARKRTMVEELLADAQFRHKNKKRYQQIMAEKAAQGADRRRRKKFNK